MRKCSDVKTYGRHKKRVIVADIWLSDGDRKASNLFGTSSENDSKESSGMSCSSNISDIQSLQTSTDSGTQWSNTRAKKVQTRNTRKARNENKENECSHNVKYTRSRSGKCESKNFQKQTTSASIKSSDESEEHKVNSTLRDRKNKIDYNVSANFKRQLKGAMSKRKRAVRTCATLKDKDAVMNFSDFENYSLCISDSPLVECGNPKSDTQAIDTNTSTPVAKRTRHKNDKDMGLKKLNEVDISHIENVASPLTNDECTPESSHSCSVFNSPSLVSSDNSNKCPKKKTSFINDSKINDASFQLQKIRDSLTAKILDNRLIHSAESGNTKPTNCSSYFSSSLFSKVASDHDVHVNDFVKEDETDSSDVQSSDDDTEDEEISDSSEPHLSAIVEQEHEAADGSDRSEFSDDDEEEDDKGLHEDDMPSYSSNEGSAMSRNGTTDVVNLQCLTDSLHSNHVSERRNTRHNKAKSVVPEIANITESLEHTHISIDSLKYSLEEKSSHITQFSPNSDSCFSDGSPTNSDDEDDDLQVASNFQTTPINKHLLQIEEQHKSFTEMLTPSSCKGSQESARQEVLELCGQRAPCSFRTALPHQMLPKCIKIGEGVYGEVFLTYKSTDESVAIKIIPIEGDFTVNDEPQKTFKEILPEIVIAKELSSLRSNEEYMTYNYCEVNNVSCVKGKYPMQLLKQWDVYNDKKHSENDRPDIFPATQLYIVFEFSNCGTALESYEFDSILQAKSVLTQVVFALAVAETAIQFEHRDLHWGNILVRPTAKEYISFRLLGTTFSVPTIGVEASVIDFTLSRLTKDKCTVYTNLAEDESLFQGKGEYQFDIYREMRKENQNEWKKFCPHSNVLWLHYLTDKLIYHKNYPASRLDRDILRQFRTFLSTVLDYRSAAEITFNEQFLNS